MSTTSAAGRVSFDPQGRKESLPFPGRSGRRSSFETVAPCSGERKSNVGREITDARSRASTVWTGEFENPGDNNQPGLGSVAGRPTVRLRATLSASAGYPALDHRPRQSEDIDDDPAAGAGPTEPGDAAARTGPSSPRPRVGPDIPSALYCHQPLGGPSKSTTGGSAHRHQLAVFVGGPGRYNRWE
jgi:hypothetical protein